MKEVTLEAKLDSIPVLTDIVEEELAQADCPPKAMIQLSVAIDEIFSNIASYAYADKERAGTQERAAGAEPAWGFATVRIELLNEPRGIDLTFIDRGIPFDPLKREDPDISAPLGERQIAGLGIFMVKKTMSSMKYEYSDGRNILTIRKLF